jgi:hypothetical protein
MDEKVRQKRQTAHEAIQALPPEDTQAKKDIATTALQNLPEHSNEASRARKDVATTAIQGLSSKDQADIARLLQAPSQQVTNRIWQWIVAAFSIVFVVGTGALVVGVFINPEQLQILVTVFTTVAGILAGFISGRASSSESPSNPSG